MDPKYFLVISHKVSQERHHSKYSELSSSNIIANTVTPGVYNEINNLSSMILKLNLKI